MQEAEVQETGLKYDRRWMLTDKDGMFLTQRIYPQMALLQVGITEEGLSVAHKQKRLEPLLIPFGTTGEETTVTIWEDTCLANEVSTFVNEWFEEALQMNVKLVYMPTATKRLVDTTYAHENEVVSFADAFPLMMIGQASLDDLNSRLQQAVPMNRFRPSLVFSGGTAFCEDAFDTFTIGDIGFRAAKPCARCVLTTVNQDTGVKGHEPLRTLSAYRTFENKVLFGQNLLQQQRGSIKIGDKLEVLTWK